MALLSRQAVGAGSLCWQAQLSTNGRRQTSAIAASVRPAGVLGKFSGAQLRLRGNSHHAGPVSGRCAQRWRSASAAVEVITAPSAEEVKRLVEEVKATLAASHPHLPVGKHGRDDEEELLWFLRDRKYDPKEAVEKLAIALQWRAEFGVDKLTEEKVAKEAATGKACLHTSPDVKGRPVVIVRASRHFPADLKESQELCVFLIEQAIQQLPPGEEKFLGIFDLREFKPQNTDWPFIRFLINVFFNYYPKRLDQVLFVDAPFIFRTGWELIKPLLKKYAALVRFCSADEVRREYFTPETVPIDFRQ